MATATSETSVEKKAQRGRRRAYHQQLKISFGEKEMAAIETTRQAISAVTGREATTSEAVRRLVMDKHDVARVEAMAMALDQRELISAPVELDPEAHELLAGAHQLLGSIQGELNVLVRRVDDASTQEISEAFGVVVEMRGMLASLERNLIGAVSDGHRPE